MLGRTDSRLRMVAILVVFALVASAAGLRLGYWQVVAAEELTARVEGQRQLVRDQAAAGRIARADIIDRDGKLMAKTASYDRLDVHPDLMAGEPHEEIVETLDTIFDLSERERADYLETFASGDQFGILRRELTFDESALVEGARKQGLLPGIRLTPQGSRFYPRHGGEPETTLAAHVLGYVRGDGRGGEGLERYYHERLTTADSGTVSVASVADEPVAVDGVEPEAMRLTLDAKLQRQVEREIYGVLIANEAKSVSAIVMDPKTGAILAAASVPSYDANEFAAVAYDDMRDLRNRLFSDQYEPGSVMKIFTATAALDAGVVTPSTVIADAKKLKFWKYTVRNSDKGSLGPLKVKDVIALSRNVATAKIAKRLAPSNTQRAAHRLYDTWEKVGMTRPTGADVTGEEDGSWFDPAQHQWAPVDLANRAFGQGVSVTLPQLARGISTIVNGGFLVQPHLVADGEAAGVEPERVLKPKVARQAKEILTHVTGSVPWYARGSLIPGYHVGGKTGTAQIWNSDKQKWKDWRFNHSFIGFIGGKGAEYVIAVRIEEPVVRKREQGNIPLSIESYELYQMIARATIKHLGMKKVKDLSAGRPIIGTSAARVLDPVRNRAAQTTRRQEKKEARAAENRQAKQAAKAKRDKDDEAAVSAAAEPGAKGSGDDT